MLQSCPVTQHHSAFTDGIPLHLSLCSFFSFLPPHTHSGVPWTFSPQRLLPSFRTKQLFHSHVTGGISPRLQPQETLQTDRYISQKILKEIRPSHQNILHIGNNAGFSLSLYECANNGCPSIALLTSTLQIKIKTHLFLFLNSLTILELISKYPSSLFYPM